MLSRRLRLVYFLTTCAPELSQGISGAQVCLKTICTGVPYENVRRVPTRNLQRFLVGTLLIMATLLVVHDGVLVGRLRLRVHDTVQDGFPVLSAIYPFQDSGARLSFLIITDRR